MFCPKCDRVYLKAKVCPHCGVELLRATGKSGNKKVSQPKSNDKVAAEIRCPQCNSRNYTVRREIQPLHYHTIKKCHPIYVAMIVVVKLFFLFKRWNQYYRCCDCGHQWRE